MTEIPSRIINLHIIIIKTPTSLWNSSGSNSESNGIASHCDFFNSNALIAFNVYEVTTTITKRIFLIIIFSLYGCVAHNVGCHVN